MKTFSDKGIELLKKLEGFSARAYADSGDKKTIGYGHLITPGDGIAPGELLDEFKATSLLRQDVSLAEKSVNSVLKAEVTQAQFDALVIFVFNIGRAAFFASTLLRKLNSGDYKGASMEFFRWNKVTKDGHQFEVLGLTRRRTAEYNLFTKGDYVGP